MFNDDGGSGVGVYNRRVEPVLVSLSDLYSIDKILVGGSWPFSCPAYTIY